jgi:hypothetical protein
MKKYLFSFGGDSGKNEVGLVIEVRAQNVEDAVDFAQAAYDEISQESVGSKVSFGNGGVERANIYTNPDRQVTENDIVDWDY